MQKILTAVEETAKLIKLAVIESDEESLRSESSRLLALGFVLSEIAEMRTDAEEPSNNNNKNNQPKVNHGNTRLPYGLCKREGIDTTGMTPREAWEALAGKGISAREEYKRLKEKSSPKVDIATARATRTTKREEFKKRMSNISVELQSTEHLLHNAKTMLSYAEKDIKSARRTLGIESKEDAERLAGVFRDEYNKIKDERAELWKKGNDPSIESHERWAYIDKYNELEGKADSVFWQMRGAEKAVGAYNDYEERSAKLQKAQERYNHAKEESDKFWAEEEESNEEYYKAVRQQFPTVDSCKTPQDVSEYMLATGAFDGADKTERGIARRFQKYADPYGMTSREAEPVDLSGCAMETAKEMAKANEMMIQKIPAFKECLSGIESEGLACSSSTYGCSFTDSGEISLNPKYYADPEGFKKSFEGTQVDNFDEDGNRVPKGMEGTGVYSWHPKGIGTDSVYVHEASHTLAYWITYKQQNEPAHKVPSKLHFENEVIKAVNKKFKTNKKNAWKKISRYAMKNEAEFFAEAMSLYLCGDGSNEVANFVGEYTINKLKEMGYDR